MPVIIRNIMPSNMVYHKSLAYPVSPFSSLDQVQCREKGGVKDHEF